MIKVNLGCGTRPLPGFINVDARDIKDIEYPNTRIENMACFDDNYADYVYACHVLEHLPRNLTFSSICEWNRILKPGGMLRIAVPDWDATVEYYNRSGDLENLLNWLYGGREYLENSHFRIFNFRGLRTLLAEAGFKRIRKYDWRETEHADYDDFSKAYIPHMDSEKGLLMSLNVECVKHMHVSITSQRVD
jgi:predicted SAM-dependent methyltransferase